MKNIVTKMSKGILNIFLVLLVSVAVSACNDDDKNNIPTAHKTFVLVHGAWQAAFVWNDVKADLEQQGHTVVVVELQAHGQDQSALSDATLTNYVTKVTAAVNSVPGQVVLVGHSLGGAVITEVGANIPSKIEKLVYVAGFIPGVGKSVLDMANQDAGSLIGPALAFSADMSTVGISNPTVNVPMIFCQDGSAQIQNTLVQNQRPEPVAPLGTPLQYDLTAYGKLDKYYIYTTSDHAISYPFQQTMVQAAGITKTFTIATGHSPFLSKPTGLTTILTGLTK